jgi:heptaprenyl diphosphate synthase
VSFGGAQHPTNANGHSAEALHGQVSRGRPIQLFGLPGVEAHLDRVERALTSAVAAEDPFLTEVAGHLVTAGGKRLRPALVLAAAAALDAEVDEHVIQGAVSVELVHQGSLYHDDVMDEAAQRRGVESVNHRWGNLIAILAGDFLLARASEIAASLGTDVAGLLARTIVQLCEGEVSQLQYAFDVERTEAAYLRAVKGKTASLLATSARVGALVTRAGQTEVEALTDYGVAFGVAFQIWDDVCDLVATDDQIGKPAGHDLVEGTYTLPVIRALALPGLGDELRGLLGGPLDEASRDKARDLIRGTVAVDSSLAEARRWADRASDALAPLGDGPAVTALAEAGHRLIDSLDER